jgi:hypothetical protein
MDINNDITISQAIAKGHKMLTIPSLVIFIGVISFGVFLDVRYIHEGWPIAASLGAAAVLSCIFWCYKVTQWRIWAFGNIRNVHELKKKAIDQQLIWPDDHFLTGIEISTQKQREQLKEINVKFSKKDHYSDDLNVPFETIIYYSKSTNYLEMIGYIVVFGGFGFYLFYQMEKGDSFRFFAIPIVLYGIYKAYKEYKQATNKTPQITINESGIKTFNTEFSPWSKIRDEQLVGVKDGKEYFSQLRYIGINGLVELIIDDYDILPDQLEHLLRIYRIRSKTNDLNKPSKPYTILNRLEADYNFDSYLAMSDEERSRYMEEIRVFARAKFSELTQFCHQCIPSDFCPHELIYESLSEEFEIWEEFLSSEVIRIFELAKTSKNPSEITSCLEYIIPTKALTDYSEKTRNYLLKELDNADARIRLKAIWIISFWLDQHYNSQQTRIINHIMLKLKDDHWKIRWTTNYVLKDFEAINQAENKISLLDKLKGKFLGNPFVIE